MATTIRQHGRRSYRAAFIRCLGCATACCWESPTVADRAGGLGFAAMARRRLTSSVSKRGDGRESGADELVAAVLRATAQPIWVVDAEGLIRFANPAAIAALCYDGAKELVGRQS